MSSSLQVRLTETRERLPLNREQWNALAAGNSVNTAFQTFEWFDTWWSAFGSRHRLHLLTVHDQDTIIGLAPLMHVQALGLRHLEFIGTPNADYQDLIVPIRTREAIAAICGHLHANRKQWDMVVLRNLRAESPVVGDLVRSCTDLGLATMDLERQPCPALRVQGNDSEVDQILDRYSVRRILRRLARRGELRYHKLETAGEIDGWLEEFFAQHISRWQSTHAPSPFGSETYRKWYRELAHAAHAAGWLHFSRLDCGSSLAAAHFGFSHGGTLSWYKPSFNRELSRESPGIALIASLIADARSAGLDEFDFAGGFEPFKARFSNSLRECLNLRIFSSPLLRATFVTGAWLRRATGEVWRRWNRFSGGD